MLEEIVKRSVQLILLFLLQVLLMNHIHIAGYGTPLVYVAFLIYLPYNFDRVATLVLAFLLGFMVDMFSNTPGMSCAAMTFVALIQPNVLNALIPKDSSENMVPNYFTMGRWNHLRYMSILLAVHHVTYYLLESFSFYNYTDLLQAVVISYALSWLVIAVTEFLRG